ncbi:hypothetical protein CAPTEDRAFT_202056 [Capitella teleta]|uniref:Calcineurin-like phosphoesterase domain-containing protein n=1 Tax=Capitella teleta TaxID=283909 RepID=R7T5P9_CAPTE|nr:hypothetical protein CAPTEDRAFT_202056 [Capitella teleta]|eukprot:ELT88709.1 hypothetical protein CAPTEDRAFT_202056 [Capitella teleta]
MLGRTSVLLTAVLFCCVFSDLTTAQDPNVLRVITIGDWGEVLFRGQALVAEQMARWSGENDPEFILGLGDNIYQWGIFSVDDPQLDRKWRDVYQKNHTELADLQWRLIHGNHDLGFDNGEEWNQVWLTDIEPLWYFPHLWWDFVVEKDDFSVHFFMIDTESMRSDTNNHTDMWPWLDNALSTSDADWKIVVGHRDLYAVGSKGPVNSRLYEQLLPVMEQYGVDVYLCGHDHNLQHIRAIDKVPGDVDFVVNGAGGALWYAFTEEKEVVLREEYSMEVAFFEMTWGFAPLIITKDELRFDFINDEGELIYSFSRTRDDQAPR